MNRLDGTMCQHDFSGKRIFQHRHLHKWELFRQNKTVPGFRFEQECRGFIAQLQRLWKNGSARSPFQK
jgi:hypothetical protein